VRKHQLGSSGNLADCGRDWATRSGGWGKTVGDAVERVLTITVQ